MAEFPAMSHVAVTVTDLAVVSRGMSACLAPSRCSMRTLAASTIRCTCSREARFWGSTSIRQPTATTASTSTGPAWTIFPSGSSTAPSSRCGRPGSRSSGFPMERLLTPITARGCRSATPTTSPWSSSRRPDRSEREPTGRDRPAGSVADLVDQVADVVLGVGLLAARRPQLGNGAV
jgi:hypothetical protein